MRNDWIWMVLFWLFGLVFVIFPAHVMRFYRWFLGPNPFRVRQEQPRHYRNAGIFWLILMAIVTYMTWK